MNSLHLKQAFRTLRRNRVYTFINLASLGIAGAFALLVAVYAVHAFATDTYSPVLKSLYRIETTDLWTKPDSTKRKGIFDWLAADADVQRQLVTPLVLAPDLKQNFSEIEAVCRIQNEYSPVLEAGNQRFTEGEKNVAWVDKNFFSLFDLPLLTSKSEAAFANVHNVVLSVRAAKKYFGTQNPVGKVLRLRREEGTLYTVSAVAKDFPANGSMQFDVVFCIDGQSDYAERLAAGTNQSSYLTVIKLKPETDLAAFRKKLSAFGEGYFKDWVESGKKFRPEATGLAVNLSLRPFSESHFNVSSPWFHFTDLKSLYQLLLLALIAVGVACLNYVLLSLSRVALRSQEAGIRKTVGAGWRQIVSLFLTETFVLVALSIATGFALAVLAVPFFNRLAGISIPASEVLSLRFAGIAFGLVLLLTLLAGIYPAVKMAGMKPLNVLSKFGTYKLHPALSKVFITLQYTACTVLIVFAIVIARQLRFVNDKDLGFDKEQTLVLKNPFLGDKEKTVLLRQRLRDFAAAQPAIAGFTGAGFRYANGFNTNGHTVNGKKEMITDMTVDYNFFELAKIPILKGRAFSPQFASDTSRLNIPKAQLDSLNSQTKSSLVVNETLYNTLGRPPLDELNPVLGGFIVGVCKDYFYTGLQQKIGPAYHRCRPDRLGYFWFKLASTLR